MLFSNPKLILVLVNFIEDIVRFITAIFNWTFNKGGKIKISSRRKFISKLGLGLASIPFFSLNFGMIWGKNNIKVLNYTLLFDDLPSSFHGYKLTQISDLHSGNLDSLDQLESAVDLINKQNSNLILFTGDMVNNIADEILPWKELISSVKAPHGKYAVLGNHDYGDYTARKI